MGMWNGFLIKIRCIQYTYVWYCLMLLHDTIYQSSLGVIQLPLSVVQLFQTISYHSSQRCIKCVRLLVCH